VRGFPVIVAVMTAVSSAPAEAQLQTVPFDDPRWTLIGAKQSEVLGRPCIEGTAILSDVAFANGVIEVDLAVTGARSYPGLLFRIQSEDAHEEVYVRPHRAGLYPDAVQYTPVFNGVAGWQLYNGAGYTAATDLPRDTWLRLRLEVSGTQARLFIGDRPEPALRIDRLEHGESAGAIGVYGPSNGTACFAEFRYAPTDTLTFDAPQRVAPPAGTIAGWEISRAFKIAQANRNAYPRFYFIHAAQWEPARPDARGLVDVARYRKPAGGGGDAVLVRTVVRSPRRQDATFTFGYSDDIDLFLNGHKLFGGRSGYQSRDPSFLGVVGPWDAARLTLEPGLNEIAFFLTENFGGWGFTGALDADVPAPLRDHSLTELVWQTPDTFLTPESVLYDRDRQVLYVTSFDNQYREDGEPTGYISRLGLDGTILDLKWVDGLRAPTGIAILGNRLLTLERGTLTEIDIDRGRVVARHPVEGSEFLNDLAVGPDGAVYMSDTRPSNRPDSRIYRYKDGTVDVWLNEGIDWSNGLYVHGNELLVGNSGDGFLTAVDLDTKRVRRIVCLGARVLDGIRVDHKGNYLVSHWEGQVYRVSPDGTPVEILDLLPEGQNTADFEYIPETGLIVIPTFVGNRVIAYRYGG
jgi:sugar lactone lactonase YvrE